MNGSRLLCAAAFVTMVCRTYASFILSSCSEVRQIFSDCTATLPEERPCAEASVRRCASYSQGAEYHSGGCKAGGGGFELRICWRVGRSVVERSAFCARELLH